MKVVLVWGLLADMRYLLPCAIGFLVLSVWAQDETGEHRIDHTVMHQDQLVIPEGMLIPQLGLQLRRDETDGYNLHLELRNFLMESPDFRSDSSDPVVRGHAHLYLNGVKLTRLYAADLHLPARLFRPGINSLQISINDHNHSVWAIDKEPIQATILLNPDRDPFQMSHYSSSPIQP